jgi:hypothetical protein
MSVYVTPIILNATKNNVAVNLVNSFATAAWITSERWAPLNSVLRVGNGTYVSPNVNSVSSLLFDPQSTVKITVAAHWALVALGRLSLGYADASAIFQSTTASGNTFSNYTIYPTGPFQVVFKLITTATTTTIRKGVVIDVFVIKGF